MHSIPVSEDTATTIEFTEYARKEDNAGTPAAVPDWAAFCTYLRNGLQKTARTKEQLPLIGPHVLRPGATRGLTGTERVTLCAIDVDQNVPDVQPVLSEIAFMGWAAFIHGSPRDPQPGTRKLRLWMPLSRSLAPHECGPLRRVVAAMLNVTVDQNTLDASRMLFVGALRGTPAREVWEFEGVPLPVDELLQIKLVDPEPAPKPRAKPVGEPSKADPSDRVAQVIETIEPHYTERRHDLTRALGSWLATRSMFGAWSDGEIRAVIEALPSDQTPKRVYEALDAAAQARAGNETTIGWQTLKARLGEDASRLERAAMSAWELRCEATWVDFIGRKRAANDTAEHEPFKPAAETADRAEPATRSEQRTDLGNARRLVRGYGDSLRYFEARKLWYVWDGSRWKADNTGEIVRAAKDAAESLWLEAKEISDDDKRKAALKWAGECQDRSRLTNMIELAKSEPGIPVTAAELDADPWLLNVQNGTLDLRTGELRDPDPILLMTKCCGTHYDPAARSDLWEAFVTRTTGGDTELAAYIQRSLGYALFGAWREKAFWFGYGPPDGAKSTLLGAIGDVLGDYHVAASASTWMVQNNVGGNRGDVTRLLGARFVTSLEIRPGLRFDEELVKKVTGGDTIVAAGKYENEIQFPPTFALWMGANDRPTIRDDDEGMWSRMRCVPFTHPVPDDEKDPHLREKLTSEAHAPAVLAWLVAGCVAWQREGIGKCAAVTTATQAYRADMNRAGAFFEECCELGTGHETAAKAMRHAYDEWCKANGVRSPLTANALGQRLRALGATGGDDDSRRTVRKAVPAVGTFPASPAVKDRFWFGVRLRSESD